MTTSLLPPNEGEILDTATRREFLVMLGAAGLLAACGDGNREADDAGAPPSTRTVRTDAGTVEVPVDPQRVVAAIGSFETDMVAVGVMPVMTSSFAGPWVELDESVTITENIPPNAEELLAVRPDLLVGWSWVTEEPIYDELVQVAPYVGLGESAATAGPGFDGSQPLRSWDSLFLSVCDAVGRRSHGEQLVADFEARLDALAARRSGQAATSVARIEFYEAGSFTYRGTDEDTAELMRRIGLTPVGPQATEQAMSLERLPEIDADWLVIPVGTESIPRQLFDEVAATEFVPSDPCRGGRVGASCGRRPVARARPPLGPSVGRRPRTPLRGLRATIRCRVPHPSRREGGRPASRVRGGAHSTNCNPYAHRAQLRRLRRDRRQRTVPCPTPSTTVAPT